MNRKLVTLFAVLLALSMALSACAAPAATNGPAATSVPATVEQPSNPTPDAAMTGTIVAAGSSTVYPLAEAMAERYEKEGFAGEITISSIGSGAGFERFCVAGETDISTASRKIKDSEVESCKAIGRAPIEFRVGTDAIAIVVSSENDFLTDVTKEELGKIFSSTVTNWSEVRAEWPNEPIQRFSPGTDSGTFDYFVEVVMGPLNKNAEGKADLEAGKTDILNATNIQFSEDDNVLVLGVEGSRYAIGYFGFAYYVENKSKLKTVAVEGVTPTEVTAESGEYALARPLFMYSDAGILKSKPQVAKFLDFVLTYVNDEIGKVGYFPASAEALNASAQALVDALK
jgi:phosphate binding protein